MRRQLELGDERPQFAHIQIDLLERACPQAELLLVVQARHSDPGPIGPLRAQRVLARHHHRYGGSGQEGLGRRPLVAVQFAGLDEQRGGQQDRLALPQAGEPVALRGVGRHVLGAHRVEPEPRAGGRGGAEVGPAAQVAAGHLDQCPVRPALGEPVRGEVVRGRQRLRHRGAAELPVQPGVQVGRAQQEVQDPLVQPQPGGRQPRRVVQFDDPPAPERGDGRERAPVRFREGGEGEGEGREGPLRVTAGGGTASGRRGLQLYCGGEEYEVPLEGGEAEAGSEGVERGGPGAWCEFGSGGTAAPLRDARRMRVDTGQDTPDLRGQRRTARIRLRRTLFVRPHVLTCPRRLHAVSLLRGLGGPGRCLARARRGLGRGFRDRLRRGLRRLLGRRRGGRVRLLVHNFFGSGLT